MKIALIIIAVLIGFILGILMVIGGMILLLRLVFRIVYGKPPEKPSEGSNLDDLDLGLSENDYKEKWDGRGWKQRLKEPERIISPHRSVRRS